MTLEDRDAGGASRRTLAEVVCKFGKKYPPVSTAMEYERFPDFDEFAESVRDVDARMLFQNPTRRSWAIDHLNLPEVHVQLEG